MQFEGNRIQQVSRRQDEGAVVGVWGDIINFSTSGDNTIIAGSTGRIIRIKTILFVVGGITNIQFFSGASASNKPLSGLIPLGTYGSVALDGADFSIETQPGDSLVINSSQAAQTGGWVRWVVA